MAGFMFLNGPDEGLETLDGGLVTHYNGDPGVAVLKIWQISEI